MSYLNSDKIINDKCSSVSGCGAHSDKTSHCDCTVNYDATKAPELSKHKQKYKEFLQEK